ncbi:MAG: 1,4-alpha-glucan branching protein GlgB [Candidatus Ancillula sp.]|jgi:1,4-alpha-glucan branching enzyme|nr:1,4-alpha-glucan branching protein GlgB [Candidatus Ancillula sp.]
MDVRNVDLNVLNAVASGDYYDPHSVLGPHIVRKVDNLGDEVYIRVHRPQASKVLIKTTDHVYEAEHEHGGIWLAKLPATKNTLGEVDVPDYRVVTILDDETFELDDPYRFLPTLGEIDLHLIAEGRHEELWRVLGANPKTYTSSLGDVHGIAFAVWAPNAKAVRVVGDFNFWNGISHSMRSLGSSGVWEIFVPGATLGQNYKFQIQTPWLEWIDKIDPLAKAAQVPPNTASVIFSSNYSWKDKKWMEKRSTSNPHTGPISVYEVHLGSWRKGLSYIDLAKELVEYVSTLGFTHVEFMPVAEHPFAPSWGYQVTGYYAPTSRFGSPDDFRYLVDELHRANIGVIVDWVPAHFPKDAFALGRFDGTALYEDPDPRRGEHPDWGTYIFNYGRSEVKNFLVANACYWFEEFHIDALRVDAVASMLYLDYSREEGSWTPNQYGGRENLEAIEFLKEVNATVYKRYSGIMMIAEESTAFTGVTAPTNYGGLGFGLKWNMGWMNDTLRYIEHDPIHRAYHHGELTFSLVYAYSENYILPLSHDEVVHGKGSIIGKLPGDLWQKLANIKLLLAYQWAHPGKQLIFMGTEFAQWHEWAGADSSIDWGSLNDLGHRGVHNLVKDLNTLYTKKSELYELDHRYEGFEWIDSNDWNRSLLSFVRKNSAGKIIVVVANFAGTPLEDFRIALPKSGRYKEVLNTDDLKYGGSGVTNSGNEVGEIVAEEVEWTNRPYSANLRVPPLGVVFLEHLGS